jgi:hypothetical protein
MSAVTLVPTPQTTVFTERRLAVKTAISVKRVMSLPSVIAELGARTERAYAKLGLKVRFFDVDGYGAEGYKLEIGTGGIMLCASGARGRLYGHYTLQQILLQHPQEVPCCVIEDQPACAWRALYLDLRMHKYTPAYLQTLVADMARLKLNTLVLDYHDTFLYKKEAWVTGDVSVTGAQIKALRETAAAHGVDVVPALNIVDGLAYVVGLAPNAGLRCASVPTALNVQHPRAVKVVGSLIEELLAQHEAQQIVLRVETPRANLAACAQYVAEITALVVRKGATPVVFLSDMERGAEVIEVVADKTMLIVMAGQRDADVVAQRARARGLQTVQAMNCRGDHEREWTHTVDAVVSGAGQMAKGLQADVGGMVWAPSAREGAGESWALGVPIAEMDGARYTHAATLWYGIAAAAAVLWNPASFSVDVLAKAWPRLWFGVDDERYVTAQLLASSDVREHITLQDAMRDRKRLIKLLAELHPPLHAPHLRVMDFYARLAIHASHTRQVFAHAPKPQQLQLLGNELARMRELHKAVLGDSIPRTELAAEQHYLFGHTELLLRRMGKK